MAEGKRITQKEYLAEVKKGLENELTVNAQALPCLLYTSRCV